MIHSFTNLIALSFEFLTSKIRELIGVNDADRQLIISLTICINYDGAIDLSI